MERTAMRVVMQDREGKRTEGVCAGPAWSGSCPISEAGAAVACAGRRIVVTTHDGRKVSFEVAADATACPLASLRAGRG